MPSKFLCVLLLLLTGLLVGSTPTAAQPVDVLRDTAAAPVLPLEEAIRLALERNYDLRIVRNEAAIARNNYTLGNAGFLPTIGLTAQQTRRTTSGFGTGGTGGGFGTGANTMDLAAGMNVTLFDGLSRFATYERLEVLAEQGRQNVERYAEQTLADVVLVYYDITRQQLQLEVLAEAVALSEERLRIAELQRDLGSASELEVRRAQVDFNADYAAVLRQEVTLANTKAAFNQLLGRETTTDFSATSRIDVDPSLEPEALLAEALNFNKTLLVVENARTAAMLERRAIRAAWLPQVGLQAGYAFNNFTDDLGLAVARPGGFTYGITASMDLFEGFNRNRRLENASLQVASRELEIEDVRTQLHAEVETAYKNYQNSLELIALEEENRTLANQNVEVALERFRLGTITSLELREVQTALTNAESRLITARYEAKQAEITLYELSGRLLEDMTELP